MAWTTPRTWVVGEIVTAAIQNTHVRDNLRTLYPDYGTTLPGSPYDSKEAILVDSITDPTYRWHLRYNNASTSSYKWECIGGGWWVTPVEQIFQANITTYQFTTATVTVGHSGLYEAVVHSRLVDGSVPGSGLYTIGVNGTADDTYAGLSTGAGLWVFAHRTFTAGDVLSVAYRVTVGSVTSRTTPNIFLKPVRIS